MFLPNVPEAMSIPESRVVDAYNVPPKPSRILI